MLIAHFTHSAWRGFADAQRLALFICVVYVCLYQFFAFSLSLSVLFHLFTSFSVCCQWFCCFSAPFPFVCYLERSFLFVTIVLLLFCFVCFFLLLLFSLFFSVVLFLVIFCSVRFFAFHTFFLHCYRLFEIVFLHVAKPRPIEAKHAKQTE